MKVIGIDPGITGAICVLRGSPEAYQIEQVIDMPIHSEQRSNGKVRRTIDAIQLKQIIEKIEGIDLVICEKMLSPPGVVGGMQSFSMGFTMGVLVSVLSLLKLKTVFIYPHRWKRGLNIPAAKEAAIKEASKHFKSDQHWRRKKDHNRAESALLALYGLRAYS